MAGQPKILLVEDNEEIVDIYAQVLRSHGYEVVTVSTIQAMLDTLPQFMPNVILLDIMLPGGLTGIDGLKIIRKDPAYKAEKTKVVLLTNLGETEEVRKIWQELADGYVIKAEIDPHELPEIIQSVFPASPAA